MPLYSYRNLSAQAVPTCLPMSLPPYSLLYLRKYAVIIVQYLTAPTSKRSRLDCHRQNQQNTVMLMTHTIHSFLANQTMNMLPMDHTMPLQTRMLSCKIPRQVQAYDLASSIDSLYPA